VIAVLVVVVCLLSCIGLSVVGVGCRCRLSVSVVGVGCPCWLSINFFLLSVPGSAYEHTLSHPYFAVAELGVM
jgi:hypothetical protein